MSVTPTSTLNAWRVGEAIASVRRLAAICSELTAEEVVRAIALEEASQRRRSILAKLYRQADLLARQVHHTNLQAQIQSA